MEENKHTPLTDEFLQSLQGMKAVNPDPFFYTRLKGRMQRQQSQPGMFNKPAWLIVTLACFFSFNIWMIFKQDNVQQDSTQTKSSAEMFADTYNLNSNSNY